MTGRFTRRRFVAGAAATGAAMAAPEAEARKAWGSVRTADVVVVGAGLAGLTAAAPCIAPDAR